MADTEEPLLEEKVDKKLKMRPKGKYQQEEGEKEG